MQASNIPSIDYLNTLNSVIVFHTTKVEAKNLKVGNIVRCNRDWMFVGNIYSNIASRKELVRVYDAQGLAYTFERNDAKVTEATSYVKD